MKKYCIQVLILMLFFSGTSFAQLADTKWRGTFYIPSETECYMQFKKDTLNLLLAESEDIVEVMDYAVSGDTLTIRKLSGGSPCDENAAIYTFKIKADKLKLTILKDNCSARASAGLDGELTRVEAIKKED